MQRHIINWDKIGHIRPNNKGPLHYYEEYPF